MDAPANPFRAYDVTSPTGESFSAAVVIGEDGFWHVLSDRSGTWADEPGIAMEDLLMPEQNMAEWDIVPAGKRTNGNGTEPKAPDAKKKTAANSTPSTRISLASRLAKLAADSGPPRAAASRLPGQRSA